MNTQVKATLRELAFVTGMFLSLATLFFATGCGPTPRDGKPGAVGAQGKPGVAGVTGATGQPGKDGEQGPQGNPGQDGRDGTDATPVTIVKLCPGVTTYPTTFVEIAFCVGGKLYGTYSANGGFSTELPPGAYSSNGIGSSCNFTIGPNCEVIN